MIVTTEVEDPAWNVLAGIEDLTRSAIRHTLSAEGADGEVAVLFTGDDEIATLNNEWRGKPGATNVLSFPADDFPVPPGEAKPLGDIVLAYGTVAREAEAQAKTLRDHTIHLIVHGTLHLLGHDHLHPAEADAMEDLERRILSEFGIADPYER